MVKKKLSKKFNFLWNQLDALVFYFFTRTTPPKKLITKWPVVEQRHVWSIWVLLFLLRAIQMSTHVIWKYFTKKCQNKIDFPDIILNFSKMVCVLPLTLCMTGELWPRRFIWHQDIRVTHCQSSAMSFIFTQYYFCNSFRQGLIGRFWPSDKSITKYCRYLNAHKNYNPWFKIISLDMKIHQILFSSFNILSPHEYIVSNVNPFSQNFIKYCLNLTHHLFKTGSRRLKPLNVCAIPATI